MYFIYLPKNCL